MTDLQILYGNMHALSSAEPHALAAVNYHNIHLNHKSRGGERSQQRLLNGLEERITARKVEEERAGIVVVAGAA